MIKSINKYICIIRQEETDIFNRPSSNNLIYYTEMKKLQTCNSFRNFSVKFTIDGTENYKLSSKSYQLKNGMCLLAAKQPFGQCIVDSEKLVKGVCIDINQNTLAEAICIIKMGNSLHLDNLLDGYFSFEQFPERISILKYNLFHAQLIELQNFLLQYETIPVNSFYYINEEWFLSLAEKVVLQEFHNKRNLEDLSLLKNSTKKEILVRLIQAKEFMDDNLLYNPCIREIAKAACLSEFYFYKTFKQAYKITPYRYMMKRRLKYAAKLLQIGTFTIGQIAIICNFPDLATFSKAYKRNFGYSPSKHIRMRVA